MSWIPWAVAVASLGVFFALGLAGWPGEFVAAGGMFCEAFRSSWIGQPANTWSNLGFVAAGLWIGERARGGLAESGFTPNRFTRSRGLPVLYAALVVFLGPGSMAMHASGRAWGATVDVVSMLLYIAFPVAWGLTRWTRASERSFWLLFGVIALGMAVPRALGVFPVSGSAVYAVIIPAIIVLETLLYRRQPAGSRSGAYLLGGGACFLLALVIWRLSHSGAPLCDPGSLVQGHAIWHLLCAGATFFIFLGYASEADEG